MDIFTIFLIGVGLSMDAAAVSIVKGMCIKKNHLAKNAFRIAIVFGLFQGVMPLIGYFLGSSFASYIQDFDHWIAFVLLFIIGVNMIREAFDKTPDVCSDVLSFHDLIVLGVATSIDALAIGVSFAFLDVHIFLASACIALTTFLLSLFCVFMGKRLGNIFKTYAEVFGGSILVFLGLKIVIEHLFL